MGISAGDNYRDILRAELNARLQSNPRYSLRAFARDLGLVPSRVSEILNGKQGLSRSSARAIATKLGFSKAETALFSDLVESVHARSPLSQQLARGRLQKYVAREPFHTLQLDAFKAVSDWYHFAILELIRLPNFHNDPSWIARNLEIHRSEVIAALGRLERLGLLERKGEKLRVAKDFVASPDGVPSEAIKKFHKQILEKAAAALYAQDVNERDFSTILMPIDSRELPTHKKMIRAFRRRLCRSASESDRLDQVYCLSVQYFRVSKKDGSHD